MKWSKCVTVVGCHAEGEVGRVITGGVLPPPGATMMEKKKALENDDKLRRFLIFEPRGGVFCHYNLVLPPCNPAADAGFIVMEPTDYPSMSGSNCICTVTVLLETGQLEMKEPLTHVTLDTPAGLVKVKADCRDGKCERVTLTNVACFVAALDLPVRVGDRTITVDVAYGGAFFALVDATQFGLTLEPGDARRCVELGEEIKASVAAAFPVSHPDHPEIHTVTFVEFVLPVVREEIKAQVTAPAAAAAAAAATASVVSSPPQAAEASLGWQLVGRNAVVVSPGKIDRSPCGTGTSARLAVLHARGQIQPGQRLVSRSIIGTEFWGEIVETATVGPAGATPAIVPTISGRAWITGISQYGLDPADPFPEGYVLSDTWHRHPLGGSW